MYAGGEWLSDIKTSQLPHILKGVGPVYHVTQLCRFPLACCLARPCKYRYSWSLKSFLSPTIVQGMYDLFRLPYDQYMDDGRIVWGIQRGASSFTTSSGVAIVELTSRALETVQWMAQMAYDLVTPTDRHSTASGHAHFSQALLHQHKAPHQPLDFREGVANAYDVVSAVSPWLNLCVSYCHSVHLT